MKTAARIAAIDFFFDILTGPFEDTCRKETVMTAGKKILCLLPLTVVTIAALTTILFYAYPRLHGADYAHDVDNPLHEAVVLYYRDKKDDAKSLLRRLSRQDKYAGQALINYGLFLEREGDISGAESYYRKALGKGEHIALVYIIGLHSQPGVELPGHAFTAAGNLATPETSCWVEYRRAEERLLKSDREGALAHLAKSVESGLPLTSLVYWDPLFAQLKGDGRFKELLAKARSNNAGHGTLSQRMELDEFTHFKNRPYGMAKELMKAAALEPGNDAKAEELLTPLLSANLPPRDHAIALYWLARIRAKKKDMAGAAKYLAQFKSHIRSGARDTTGFIAIARKIEDDLYANDPLLKNVK